MEQIQYNTVATFVTERTPNEEDQEDAHNSILCPCKE